MGWQSQMSIAVDGGNRPTVPGQACSSINDTACSSAAVLLPPLGAAQQKMLVREPDCGLLYVVQTSRRRLAVWWSVAA